MIKIFGDFILYISDDGYVTMIDINRIRNIIIQIIKEYLFCLKN